MHNIVIIPMPLIMSWYFAYNFDNYQRNMYIIIIIIVIIILPIIKIRIMAICILLSLLLCLCSCQILCLLFCLLFITTTGAKWSQQCERHGFSNNPAGCLRQWMAPSPLVGRDVGSPAHLLRQKSCIVSIHAAMCNEQQQHYRLSWCLWLCLLFI